MIHDDARACWELVGAKARYCRLLDGKEWLALAELFCHDVTFDLTDVDPAAVPVVGRSNVIAAIEAAVQGAKTAHQVHAPEIDLSDTGAQVIWAVQERVVWEGGSSLTAYGHYHEQWIRSGGDWKIAALRLTHSIMDFA